MAKKPSSKKPKATKPSLDVRIKTDAALRKRVLANPGLRSKLSTSSLQKYAPAQAKARALRIRLDAPITPGSSTTERMLAHEAQAAQTVKYQPQETEINKQLGIAQQTERDTGSFYDQYQQALQAHSANIQAFQAGAQQALQQTQAGITGLGQQAAVQMQQGANQQAAQQGVAPAGDLSTLANQALAQRQQLAGTFGAEQAATGAAANRYADTLANVVAPGQKLTALAQARGRTGDVRQKLADLKTEEGAFNQQYRTERRQDEFKNVLARQTLGVNAAAKAADAAANTPAAKAAATGATAAATQAAKYGYTPHQWAMLGPNGRQRAIKKFAAKKSGGGGAGDHYGYSDAQWNRMSPAQKRQAYKDWNAAGRAPKEGDKPSAADDKKAFRQKYGVDMQTTTAHNSVVDQVSQARNVLKNSGKKGPRGTITTGQLVQAMTQGGEKGIPKLPAVVIRAALDITRYGGITAATANRLHRAGYSVAQLGFKMGKPKRGGSNIPAGKV